MIKVSVEPQRLEAGRDCELRIRFSNEGPGNCTDVIFRLGLPPGFFLLRGRDRIRIPELGAGATWAQDVTVRARTAGAFTVTSENFSYRNEYGTPVRVPDFRAGLTVTPALPALPAGPDFDVTLASGILAPGEWDVLAIRVRNASQSPLRGITLTVGGPVRIGPPGPLARLPPLAAGQETEVSFIACPAETGNSVPAEVHLTYRDGSGVRSQDGVMPLMVRAPPAATAWTAPRDAAVEQDTVLFLAASPTDMFLLRSDLEMREIREALQLGKLRERFRLEWTGAARLKDIGQALASWEPRIVHFSGHGGRDGSVYVEDESGYSIPVAPEGVARLFRLHAKTIDCVIVNACYSLRLAEAMRGDFDYVIAMQTKIADNAAINFSIGFYQGLANGDPVPLAFERGIAFLQSLAARPAEHTNPVLLSRDGTR